MIEKPKAIEVTPSNSARKPLLSQMLSRLRDITSNSILLHEAEQTTESTAERLAREAQRGDQRASDAIDRTTMLSLSKPKTPSLKEAEAGASNKMRQAITNHKKSSYHIADLAKAVQRESEGTGMAHWASSQQVKKNVSQMLSSLIKFDASTLDLKPNSAQSQRKSPDGSPGKRFRSMVQTNNHQAAKLTQIEEKIATALRDIGLKDATSDQIKLFSALLRPPTHAKPGNQGSTGAKQTTGLSPTDQQLLKEKEEAISRLETNLQQTHQQLRFEMDNSDLLQTKLMEALDFAGVLQSEIHQLRQALESNIRSSTLERLPVKTATSFTNQDKRSRYHSGKDSFCTVSETEEYVDCQENSFSHEEGLNEPSD